MPDEPEVRGLLALLLLTDARRATRCAPDGRLLLLEEQDRARWDRPAIDEGTALVRDALRGGRPGRFALQAAIAAAARPGPDLPRHRLAADPAPLRPARAGLDLARGRAQPGGRAGHGGRARGRPGRDRGPRTGRPPGRLPLPARRQGRPAAPARPGGRRRRRPTAAPSSSPPTSPNGDFLARRLAEAEPAGDDLPSGAGCAERSRNRRVAPRNTSRGTLVPAVKRAPGSVKFRAGGDSPRPGQGAQRQRQADPVKLRDRRLKSGWEAARARRQRWLPGRAGASAHPPEPSWPNGSEERNRGCSPA